MTASKKPVDSTCCVLCTEVGINVDKIQEAFRDKFKEQLNRIRDSYCVSCEALKVELALLRSECEELDKNRDYYKKTLERFTGGEKKLNLILDKSKVSVKNSGLGFNSLEHSKNHPPKIARVVESGLFEVEPPESSKIVFRSDRKSVV